MILLGNVSELTTVNLLKVMFAAARTFLRSCVTAVELILCSLTNYLLLLPMQLKVNCRNDM